MENQPTKPAADGHPSAEEFRAAARVMRWTVKEAFRQLADLTWFARLGKTACAAERFRDAEIWEKEAALLDAQPANSLPPDPSAPSASLR